MGAKRKPDLLSVDDVVREVGGDGTATSLAGVVPHAVSMWRARGNLPPDTYVLFTAILAGKGLTADPALWRMKERGAA